VSQRETARRVVYYDHRAPDPQPGFRSGEAGFVVPDRQGGLEKDLQVHLPPNALHALFEHGVAAQLAQLPLSVGPLGEGRDAVIRPAALDAAAEILWEADRKTYGRIWEFTIGWPSAPGFLEYRIVIDNRGYQRSLSQLQFLVSRASREGHAVWLRL
jgi:hypothetical protein